MKKYLLLFFALCGFVLASFDASAAGSAKFTFDPHITYPTSASYWRWRNDVSTMLSDDKAVGSTSSGWITNLNVETLPTISTNRPYRIRLGQNFALNPTATATNSNGTTTYFSNKPVVVTEFSLESPVTYKVYYRKEGNANWSPVPTTRNDTVPLYLIASNYFANGIAMPATEEGYQGADGFTANVGGRQVLPAFGVSGRPSNPYYYLGGLFDSRTQSGTASAIGYSFGKALYPFTGERAYIPFSNGDNTNNDPSSTSDVADRFITAGSPSAGYTTGQLSTTTTNLNLGVEIEGCVAFTKALTSGSKYYIGIQLEVPYNGQGHAKGAGTYLIYNMDSYVRTFKSASSLNSDGSNQNARPLLIGDFIAPSTILPVSLKSFVATKQGTSAQLNWVTASEINNKGFYVQRSTDGKTFNNLGFVASQASGGNSTTTLNYNYTDATPGSGAVYYRLNQVDLDGTSKYSDIQSLFMGTSSADVMVAPNPVISNVNLNNAQVGADYAIYSMSGQLVKSGKVSASVMSIDASNLPSGIYVIKTSTNAGAPVFKKFVKK